MLGYRSVHVKEVISIHCQRMKNHKIASLYQFSKIVYISVPRLSLSSCVSFFQAPIFLSHVLSLTSHHRPVREGKGEGTLTFTLDHWASVVNEQSDEELGSVEVLCR